MPRASTPTLDALAHRGVRFETAVAHVPLTGPSHASILTGHTPLGHGYHNNGGFVLRACREDGRRGVSPGGLPDGGVRVGVPARPAVRFRSRLRRVRRSSAARERPSPAGRTSSVSRTPRRTSRCDGCRPLPREPRPRRSPGSCGCTTTTRMPRTSRRAIWPIASRRRRTTARSRSSIASSPGCSRRSQERGALGRTLVLVTADHGESLGEHGEVTHGVFIYEGTLRVPWIMAGPGISTGRVPKTVARSIDILPTLLDYCGPAVARRARRPIAAPGGRWARDGGRAVLRRVVLHAARARMGAALRVADGDAQVHRRAACGALRPRAGCLGEDEPDRAAGRRSRTRCAAACSRRVRKAVARQRSGDRSRVPPRGSDRSAT